jgi:hypothetical protein
MRTGPWRATICALGGASGRSLLGTTGAATRTGALEPNAVNISVTTANEMTIVPTARRRMRRAARRLRARPDAPCERGLGMRWTLTELLRAFNLGGGSRDCDSSSALVPSGSSQSS